MNQYRILRYCYDKVFEILKKEGEKSNLFCVTEKLFCENINAQSTSVFLAVSDIAQTIQDKNGEKVFIKEGNLPEQQFSAPTYMGFVLTIIMHAEKYQDVLETAGYIVRYFKDNNSFEAEEYNWHGNTNNTIHMEGIIREPEINQRKNDQSLPFLTLEYRLEAAINSEKSGLFKRVQERDIRGKIF
jgi:hypothetical protein